MSEPTTLIPSHWSKDFVEHLRTVHFTLIALCLGLIILALFPSKSDIKVAHDQVLEILEVTNKWDDSIVERDVAEFVRSNSAQHGVAFREIEKNNNAIGNFSLSVEGTSYGPMLAYPWIIESTIPEELASPQFEAGYFRIKRPQSIKSFQRLWDSALDNVTVVLAGLPEDCYAVAQYQDQPVPGITETSPKGQIKQLTCKVSQFTRVDKPKIYLRFRTVDRMLDQPFAIPGQADWGFEFFGAGAIFTEKNVNYGPEVISPLRHVVKIAFDEHQSLTKESPKWSAKHNLHFKDAFRELTAVDEPFAESTIGSAERILAAEMKREGDALEAMGLKIPAELAVRFGILLVLGVQLYMWIHLHEFGNRAERDAGFEVAWIGVYFSRSAQVVFLTSVLVLPWVTVVVLSYRGIRLISDNEWIAWPIVLLGNIVSLSLSYLIFQVLPKQSPPTATAPTGSANETKSDSHA